MELGTLFFVLLVLACPLMMVWMMRGHGGHGGHGHASHHGGTDGSFDDEPATRSLTQLRRRRDALDAEIEHLERSDPKTPAGG